MIVGLKFLHKTVIRIFVNAVWGFAVRTLHGGLISVLLPGRARLDLPEVTWVTFVCARASGGARARRGSSVTIPIDSLSRLVPPVGGVTVGYL